MIDPEPAGFLSLDEMARRPSFSSVVRPAWSVPACPPFETAPPNGSANPLSAEVVYVGKAYKRGIAERLENDHDAWACYGKHFSWSE